MQLWCQKIIVIILLGSQKRFKEISAIFPRSVTKWHIWYLFFSYKIRDYIISWVQFYVNLQVNYDKHIQNPWNYHYFWGFSSTHFCMWKDTLNSSCSWWGLHSERAWLWILTLWCFTLNMGTVIFNYLRKLDTWKHLSGWVVFLTKLYITSKISMNIKPRQNNLLNMGSCPKS